MKQNYKIKIAVLGCFLFGFLGSGSLAVPGRVLAQTTCNSNSNCSSGTICENVTNTCQSGAAICLDHELSQNNYFPCPNGCDSNTGTCLAKGSSSGPQACSSSSPNCPTDPLQVCNVSLGYCVTPGVQGSGCSGTGQSTCGQGFQCDPITQTCQIPSSASGAGSSSSNGSSGSSGSSVLPGGNVTTPVPNLPCPAGLSSVNGICLPPSQFGTGIASSNSLSDFLLKLIQILLSFAGVISVVMLVVGGYWYMAAGGNEELAEKGKKTILNFVLGLAIIIMAYTIVTVVISTLTGTDALIPK